LLSSELPPTSAREGASTRPPWVASAVVGALRPGDVRVWSAYLDQPPSIATHYETLLSPDERKRAAAFRFPHDRVRYIVRRGILRTILGAYLNADASALSFAYGPFGKPLIQGPQDYASIRFNVSHRQGMALYALSRDQDLGVDIEFPHSIPEADQISERFFSTQENAVFLSLPLHQRQEAFFRCWTRKEAFIKAIGEGFSFPLHCFDVAFEDGTKSALLSIKGNAERASRWILQDLRPAPNYVGALAIEGRHWNIRCRHFEPNSDPSANLPLLNFEETNV